MNTIALDRRFAFLMWLAKKSGRAFNPNVTVAAMRAAFVQTNERFGLRATGGVEARDVRIPTSDGATIHGRLYRRTDAGGQTLPVLLYFHGGGWVIGDVDAYDGLTRYFAREGRIAVLSVDYRLGPEDRFPRGHEDAIDAYAWLVKNAPSLLLDPARIAVGGDSAGGGLAATLANYAETRGLGTPAYALLIYPAVDATGRFPSRAQYAGDFPLTPASIEWFSKHSTSDRGDRAHPLFVPLDAPHPERHPPTYILAAQYDPLVDEGRAYFERLRAAGVPAVYDLRPSLPHAFVNFARVIPEAKRALAAGIEATAIALGARPAKVAALTGAGSGIGRALAVELANRNYVLELVDRDRAGLSDTLRLVAHRTPVSIHVLDVSDKAAFDAFAAEAIEKHGHIDLLINNAGVSIAGDVAELSVEEIAWLMNINFWGPVYGVKAFLPALQRSPDPTIVNVSSVFGFIAPPGQSAYAASKFAVRGFSEALREELRGSVHVLTAYPGGIKTNIARSARIAAAADQELHRRRAAAFEERMLTLAPEKAAQVIVRAIAAKSDTVLIGPDAVRIDVISRLLGPAAVRSIARRPAQPLTSPTSSAGQRSDEKVAVR